MKRTPSVTAPRLALVPYFGNPDPRFVDFVNQLPKPSVGLLRPLPSGLCGFRSASAAQALIRAAGDPESGLRVPRCARPAQAIKYTPCLAPPKPLLLQEWHYG